MYLTKYCLDETPRFLVRKNKFDEARAILRKMSVYNNRPPYEYNLYEEMTFFNKKAEAIFNPKKYQYTMKELMKINKMCELAELKSQNLKK